MATQHARVGEIVDLASWADDLPIQQSKAITKCHGLELARLSRVRHLDARQKQELSD